LARLVVSGAGCLQLTPWLGAVSSWHRPTARAQAPALRSFLKAAVDPQQSWLAWPCRTCTPWSCPLLLRWGWLSGWVSWRA